jgi:hypothetical protein
MTDEETKIAEENTIREHAYHLYRKRKGAQQDARWTIG